MKKYFLLFALLVLFINCNNEGSKSVSTNDVIGKEEMIQIFVDMHLADAAVQGSKIKQDSTIILYKKYYAQIFEKHKTNTNQFKKSLQYYTQHPNEMDQMYMKVVENLSIKNN